MKKDYTIYDAIKLAGDSWFIKWIVEGDPKANRFWAQWLKDNPEKGNLIAEATRLVNTVKFKEKEPTQKQITSLWDKINTQIDQEENQPQTAKRIPLLRWMGYAAAAVLAALLTFYFLNPMTSLRVGNTEHLAYYLPDSSFMEVNSASRITYNPRKWKAERTVKLEGEAFFEVEKGSPFKVITPKGSIEVLGTSFNVKTHDNGFKVECFTGVVKVKSVNGEEKTLRKGEKVAFNSTTQSLESAAFDAEEKDTWREGFFEYSGATYQEVIAEVERQYDVEVEIPEDILNEPFNGFFKNNNIDSAVYWICYPNPQLRCERNGKTVTISKRGEGDD